MDVDVGMRKTFGGRQRKEGRNKFEELSIVKDVPRIQPLGNIRTMDAIHEHARDSGLRLKGRRAIWMVSLVASVILSLLAFNRLGSNSPPDGRNGPVSSIGKSGEMKSPGGMRRELATPQFVHNSTLRPDHDMGTIK